MHHKNKFVPTTDYWYVSFWLKDFGFFNNDMEGLVLLIWKEFGRGEVRLWASRHNINMFEVLDYEVDRFVNAVFAYCRKRKKRKPPLFLACAHDYREDPLAIGSTHWNKTLEWPKREQRLQKMRDRILKKTKDRILKKHTVRNR